MTVFLEDARNQEVGHYVGQIDYLDGAGRNKIPNANSDGKVNDGFISVTSEMDHRMDYDQQPRGEAHTHTQDQNECQNSRWSQSKAKVSLALAMK